LDRVTAACAIQAGRRPDRPVGKRVGHFARAELAPRDATGVSLPGLEADIEAHAATAVGDREQVRAVRVRRLAVDIVPAWSPNGRKLAFTSDRDGNFEVYTMRADRQSGEPDRQRDVRLWSGLAAACRRPRRRRVAPSMQWAALAATPPLAAGSRARGHPVFSNTSR
jgi:WD40-like Beta Propeller Repeat